LEFGWFLALCLKTRWQRFGQFLNDLLRDFTLDFRDFTLDFRIIASEIQNKIAIFARNLRQKSPKIATEIKHKISYYKVRVSTGGVEPRWLWW